MQRKFYGYIRVSTQKQGEKGVSLQEQRDAIARYAAHGGMEIAEWFEERETAAKRGRPIFNTMLDLLRKGKADGVLIHKIDRSARNLKDWADLGEMIDQGIEVHFANESLDLHSRGGRLSADIQAVVAADFIRNLREETKKGMYGRVKQGFYPLPAPIGYLNKGKAQVKEIDPVKGPLVKMAFDLYATGKYNFDSLLKELFRMGLRNTRGGRLTRTGLSTVLNNPFYLGLIRIKRTGETFPGKHRALISKTTFDQVQNVLRGKINTRSKKHNYLFRRMMKCTGCGYSLIGEIQRGHVYYRCHTRTCSFSTAREDRIEDVIKEKLSVLQINEKEKKHLEGKIAEYEKNGEKDKQEMINSLTLQISKAQERIGRLTDAYIDRLIEKDLYETRKTTLVMRVRELEEKLEEIRENRRTIIDRLHEILEQVKRPYLLYFLGSDDEKRDLLKKITSNIRIEAKNVDLMLRKPLDEIEKRPKNTCGAAGGN